MNEPLQITVTVNAPELSHAILELASVLSMLVSAETGLLSQKHQSTAQEMAQWAAQQEAQAAQAAPGVQSPPAAAVPVQQPAPAYPPLHLAPTAPVQQPAPVPVQAPAPVQQPAAVPLAPVPTVAPAYTMDQLAVAATQLVDQGRRGELVGLLGAFGVPALTALPREQYGNFATQLRAMGAKL
ncbi:MAG: hypothetical protein ACYCYO_02165 [Bacilli bacterium]